VRDDILRHALNLIGVGRIERHELHAWDRGQLGCLFRCSHRGDHLPALAREQFGSGSAKTGRTAGMKIVFCEVLIGFFLHLLAKLCQLSRSFHLASQAAGRETIGGRLAGFAVDRFSRITMAFFSFRRCAS
jgi:hypothetical protein